MSATMRNAMCSVLIIVAFTSLPSAVMAARGSGLPPGIAVANGTYDPKDLAKCKYGGDGVMSGGRRLSQWSGKTLYAGQQLTSNSTQNFIMSPSQRYELWMQKDGNVVLYEKLGGSPMKAIWASNVRPGTAAGPYRLAMQSDGNLVAYNGKNTPIWHSNTPSGRAGKLDVQDDGNVVLYRTSDNYPYWHTGTWGGTGPGNTVLASWIDNQDWFVKCSTSDCTITNDKSARSIFVSDWSKMEGGDLYTNVGDTLRLEHTTLCLVVVVDDSIRKLDVLKVTLKQCDNAISNTSPYYNLWAYDVGPITSEYVYVRDLWKKYYEDFYLYIEAKDQPVKAIDGDSCHGMCDHFLLLRP